MQMSSSLRIVQISENDKGISKKTKQKHVCGRELMHKQNNVLGRE